MLKHETVIPRETLNAMNLSPKTTNSAHNRAAMNTENPKP